MNIALIGYGDQGRSSYEYWNKDGNTITICDQNTELEFPEGAKTRLGPDYLTNLHEFDLLVRSPGVHPREILEANTSHPEIADKVTSNTNEFFRVCKAPIVAVTGTKGKGTTSTLIARIIEASGRKVHLGGNIGVPPLDMLKDNIQENDYVVLELANYQLIDCVHSPHVAVCLMIVPEHLNWHKDMYEYVAAKQNIFSHQEPGDVAVYNALNTYAEDMATHSPAHIKLTYEVPPENEEPQYTEGVYVEGSHIKYEGKTVASVHDVKLKGRHNLENVCAAIAATWQIIGGDSHVIKKVLSNFTGLPHRLEEVTTIDGVTFVDDSFGTNPATAIVAIKAYEQPKVLILGGSDKGTPFTELVETIVENKIRYIVGIGEMGPAIVSQVKDHPKGKDIPYSLIDTSGTMKDIVATAVQHAQKGDVILLSTACASFDMFENYKDRGQQFKAEIKALG